MKLKKLVAARKRAGLSQQALAQKAGLSFSAIAHFEQGVSQPRPKTLAMLAKALGISTEELQDNEQRRPDLRSARLRKPVA